MRHPSGVVDPFASPEVAAILHIQHENTQQSPTQPKACAQILGRRKDRWEQIAIVTETYHSTAHEREATIQYPDEQLYKSNTLSTSSVAESSTMTGSSTIDLEKGNPPQESRKHSPGGKRDAEKAAYMSTQDHHHNNQRRSQDAISVTYSDVESNLSTQGRDDQRRKARRILLFLAGPIVALSFVNLFWTIVSLIITSLSQPVRLCARRLSYSEQLSSLLGPALNLQLRSIATPLPPHANEDRCYHASMLVGVHLLSPFVSMGVALAAWVVAIFWVMAGIVGDPAGLDGRDDGKESVLALRKWWEAWLLRAVDDS